MNNNEIQDRVTGVMKLCALRFNGNAWIRTYAPAATDIRLLELLSETGSPKLASDQVDFATFFLLHRVLSQRSGFFGRHTPLEFSAILLYLQIHRLETPLHFVDRRPEALWQKIPEARRKEAVDYCRAWLAKPHSGSQQ